MPLNDDALCTVCIPTFNQAEYLRAAVQSVVAQTAPVRLLVSNDASPDHTAQILEELQAEYRFEVMHHPVNLGISANLQWMLRAAETPFVVRLDSDDLVHPEYVRVLQELMQKETGAGYAHCAIQEIDSRGRALKQRQLARNDGFQDAETALRRSVHGYQVTANVILFRREALAQVDFGAGSAAFNFVEDYDLSIRLADAGWGNVYSGQVLASYRLWEGSSRPLVGRKRREVEGLQHVFTETLQGAFLRRNWPLQPLLRRRAQLALANAEVLDRAEFHHGEREAMVEALQGLGGSRRVTLALGGGWAARGIRYAVRWSALAQQWLKLGAKRVLFRA